MEQLRSNKTRRRNLRVYGRRDGHRAGLYTQAVEFDTPAVHTYYTPFKGAYQ